MNKASIEIARINKTLKVNFGLILQSETEIKNPSFGKLINKFNYLGNSFLKVTPRPFVTLDISSGKDKNDGWSANQSVNLNKQSLFSFLCAVRKLLKAFKEVKDLFYYEDGKLVLNNEEAKKVTESVISNNKHLRMQHCVVPSDENDTVFYEGIVLFINTYDNYTYITYNELLYLEYELSHIDMVSLSMQLISLSIQVNEEEEKVIEPKHKIVEQKEEEIKSTPYVRIEEPNTIPEI